MSGQYGSVEEMEKAVGEKRAQVRSIEETIAAKRGTNQATMLAVSLRNQKAELSGMEKALAHAREHPEDLVPGDGGRDGDPGPTLPERIEEQERTVRKIESAIAAKRGTNQAAMLAVSLKNARAELALLKASLEGGPEGPAASAEDRAGRIRRDIDDRRRRLGELDAKYAAETDETARGDTEVSRRFLQMEINSLTSRLAEAERAADPREEETEALRRDIGGRIRTIERLRAELEETKGRLAVAEARLGRPEDAAMCDTTRVSVEAGRLREMDNRIRTLGAENCDLKARLNASKQEKELMKKNIRELTVHCENSDRQIVELQSRMRILGDAADRAARDRDDALAKVQSLNAYIKDMRRAGMR